MGKICVTARIARVPTRVEWGEKQPITKKGDNEKNTGHIIHALRTALGQPRARAHYTNATNDSFHLNRGEIISFSEERGGGGLENVGPERSLSINETLICWDEAWQASAPCGSLVL